MSPAELTDEMLATLRREFFKPDDAREFFQQRELSRQAITYPARHLNEMGAKLTASQYRAILLTVIKTIKEHANRGAFEFFARYFLTCVQRHMRHHGGDYYEAAKAARPVGSLVGGALRKLTAGATGDRTVEVLAETHRVLASRGRIRKAKKADQQPDLFAPCKTAAKRLH